MIQPVRLSAVLFLLVAYVCPVCSLLTSGFQRGVQDTTGQATPQLGPAAIGPYYALVIGNNDYRNLAQLKTAVNDAREVAQVLARDYGFDTKVLYNATRSQVLTALDDYRALPENSNLLVYYGGHGYKDNDAHRAYWLPVDADRNHTANWINAVEVIDGIRAIPSRHILVIADSCFSGDLTMRSANAGIGEHNALLKKVLRMKSRHLMSSGGDEPVADAGAGGHSVFADALLRSLGDMDEDAFTAEALHQRVQLRVVARSAQTPQYAILRDSDGDLGDFVFFRSIKKKTPERIAVAAPSPIKEKTPERMAVAAAPPAAEEWGRGGPAQSVELRLERRLKQQTPLDRAYGLAFSPDGHLLASAWQEVDPTPGVVKNNGTVRLWNVDTGELVKTFRGSETDQSTYQFQSVVFSPDGRFIAASTFIIGPSVVEVWEVDSGILRYTFHAKDAMRRLAFSPSGNLIAAACDDHHVYIWNSSTGALEHSLQHLDIVVSVAFNPRNEQLLAAGDYKQSVRVWNLRSGTLIQTLKAPQHASYGEAVAFSPDGQTLVTGHTSGALIAWDVKTWQVLHKLRDEKPGNGVNSIAFSPDGQILAAASGQSTVRFWNAAQGTLLGESDVSDQTSSTRAGGGVVAFNPHRRLIATTLSGDTIQIWKLITK